MAKKLYDAPKGYPRGNWTEQSLRVLNERYLWKDNKGNVIETPEGLIYRVAKEVARAEKQFGADKKEIERMTKKYYELMINFSFLPNSPTLMNAGKGNNLQYSACFVLPIEDKMESIFDAIKSAALIHKSGGGTGFSFSRLRPKGSFVGASGGVASGPVSFMRIFDSATNEVKQGGTRRGANMGVLRVDHPDIEEFIVCKNEGGITNFNISVAVTDEFMKAVIDDKDYWLRAYEGWPDGKGGHYKTGDKIKKLSAKKVFQKIIDSAWKTGDPGLLFIDKINKGAGNPVPSMGPIEATNPCGEQMLYPNEACNLGSINLNNFVKGKSLDWKKLGEAVTLGVRMLDNVIDVNPFPLEVIDKNAKLNRRIGLGIMGWADLLFKLGIPYDSPKAISLAQKVMKFINEKGHNASRELAKTRGAFPNFKKSIYAKGPLMRNATITTIAPTGSISILGGASSGIEPIFALAFTHKTDTRTLKFINPIFEKEAKKYNQSEEILDWVADEGNISHMPDAPKKLVKIFKTAHDIDWKWHVKTQAAFQKYVDNAVSKTINMPNSAAKEDVEKAYLMAYKTSCKGITVFRDGCKDAQVLNIGTKDKKPEQTALPLEQQNPIRERPVVVNGSTYKAQTPVGTAFVTVNYNDRKDQPFEVFVNVGKAGSDIAADAEAIGRLISLCLRISSPGLSEKEVAELIIEQLDGIGGGGSVGFGKDRVRSLADGIAKIFSQHINESQPEKTTPAVGQQPSLYEGPLDNNKKNKDMCPKCGNASLIYEEGCNKCLACGYSKC